MSSNLNCSARGTFHRSLCKVSALFGAFCVVALGTSAAQATILTVPNTVFAVGSPSPTGGTIVASQSQPFATLDYSGTLISTVVAGDPSNALGGLDFLYQIVSDVTSPENIERITINRYTGYTVNGSFQTPNPGTIAPNTLDRLVNDVIGASFNNLLGGPGSLPAGSTSSVIVLQTNAPSFQSTFASLINGLTTQVNSYAPAGQPIPEPATMVLAAIGVGTLALVARRKQSKA
ncbi:MAG TPA: PEP-CTERM sorting domain-containing protein [Pirellulales bacterium]|nr:PEP-CTERM sorting domain-containing protein [Pirellulales bacterium]